MKLGIIFGILLILTTAIAAADTISEATYNINWTFNTGGWAKSVSISKDGRYIAAGSGDTYIYLIDMDGEKIWSHQTRGLVKNVAISANGSNVAAASDTIIYLMDFSGKPVWWHDIGSKDLSHIALSDNGTYTVAASDYPDNKIFYFNEKGVLLWTYKFRDQIVGLSLSSGGSRLAATTLDGNVYLFDSNGEIIWTYNIKTGLISGLSISPDASLIAVITKNDLYILDNLKKLKWTERIDGELIYTAFLNNGSSILAKTKSNEIFFFDAENGSLQVSVLLPDFIGELSFSNDIKQIAAGSKTPGVSVYYLLSLETPPVEEILNGNIEVSTNSLSSSFQLTGPDQYTGSGKDWRGEDVTPGTYTIQYSPVKGFITPPDESKTLSNNETIKFSGVYVPETYDLEVASEPSQASVYLNEAYAGDTPLTIEDRLPGFYDIKVTNTGYRECLKKVDLQRNEYIYCDLAPIPGTITVKTNIHSSFVLDGPQRLAYGGISTKLENLKDGTYTVTYGDVECYITPNGETKTLEKGGSITFQGDYVLKTVSIVATTDQSGIENPQGAGVYDCGEVVTVKAGKIEGYDFLKWTENGVDIAFEPEYSFMAKKDTQVRAIYTEQKVTETPPPKTPEPENPYIKAFKGLIQDLREYLMKLSN